MLKRKIMNSLIEWKENTVTKKTCNQRCYCLKCNPKGYIIL